MTLLLDARDLDARRAVARGGLKPLAQSLAEDLRKVIERPLYIPERKALLSREGGRCPRDGTMLDFDPFSPHDHRCPKCGEVYRGELHDGFWIYWYQLWLAERAVHAAILERTGALPEAGAFAERVLDGIADRYLEYPNVDNALGPTRPFFSTYLESIWLLQLCIAASMLDSPAVDRFRDAVVEPSLRLIESFDEGSSNRQVWNNAALIAGHRLLGRDDHAESVVWAESGVTAHLSSALLADGTWYEGENYHFFAHRGLWYCMQLASRMDAGIPADLVARYDAGFRAPFLTALPDVTFPSRRDSQYAVSLRQWRFAEMCELGLARGDDRVLRGMLARLYAEDVPRTDTGRWKSTAEAERNLPATRLDRSDLGWKSLLFARPTIELAEPAPLPSVLLDAQGVAVIRRNAGRVYVAMDYGVSGGGHGHPDRLNLLVSDGDRRILDDMGTGSYVDPSLHWYRSTLAHNAPMFDGRSQERRSGDLIAFEDRGGAGWISARAAIALGAVATRTTVVMPDYLLDEVKWTANESRTVDLPLHLDIHTAEVAMDAPALEGSQGMEDGFRFLRDPRLVVKVPPGRGANFKWLDAEMWLAADTELEVWKAFAPGPPGRGEQGMTLIRARGATGTIRWMWSWSGAARPATLFPQSIIEAGAERHEHSRVAHGWNVAIQVGGAKSTIDLEGLVADATDDGDTLEQGPHFREAHGTMLWEKQPRHFTLGESHYRRSEDSWAEAGSPTAEVTVQRQGEFVGMQVTVNAERSFADPGVANRLDNESADINGAGLQLYIDTGERRAGYVIVPRAERHELSIRPIEGWGNAIAVDGWWQPHGDGYRVDLRFQPDSEGVLVDLIINEKPSSRERRRGQLVLSGGKGQFIYLRGDRHEAHSLIPFVLMND